jgi:hypothetical protein
MLIFVALFWSPLYLRRPDLEVLTKVPARFQSALSPANEAPTIVLVADNTEFISHSSGNLLLQSFLWSSKLKKAHSTKLLLITTLSGLIVWRSPLFGGSTPEPELLEYFFQSDDFHSLPTAANVVILVDRGFKKLIAPPSVQIFQPEFLTSSQFDYGTPTRAQVCFTYDCH